MTERHTLLMDLRENPLDQRPRPLRPLVPTDRLHGRLIRTATAIVAIFDPRVLTKHYGLALLDALPDCKRFVDGEVVETKRKRVAVW